MFPNITQILKPIALIGLFGLAACQNAGGVTVGEAAPQMTEYEVSLRSTWTEANHPFEYPEAGVLTGPHFSGLIGATHDGRYEIFSEGKTPSPGLERLSEEGKHDPLNREIQAAIAAGNAGALIETDPLRDFSQGVSARFRVDERHPRVSAVAMIAPSPDWFAGVRNLSLMENGQWVRSKTVTLYGYDSGGDTGATYKAPDMDANPKQATRLAKDPHFVKNGQLIPVGTLTFTKL